MRLNQFGQLRRCIRLEEPKGSFRETWPVMKDIWFRKFTPGFKDQAAFDSPSFMVALRACEGVQERDVIISGGFAYDLIGKREFSEGQPLEFWAAREKPIGDFHD